VSFHKGSREELKGSLGRVIEGEKVKIEAGAVDLVVARSDGSFRNLQKTFNELVLEAGRKVTKGDAEKFFEGRIGEYTAAEMETDLAEGEVKKILARLEKMAESGADFKDFRENLLVYFQDRLLGAFGVENKEKSKLGIADLERWLALLIAAGKQEKEVAVDQLPLELAVVELLKNKISDNNPKKVVEKNEEKDSGTPVENKKSEKPVQIKDVNLAMEVVEREWGKVLTAVKPFNHSVEAFLRAARPKAVKGDKLVVEVFYPFHKDKLEEQKNREIVEKGLSIVFGAEIGFECILSKGKGETLVIKNDTPVEKISGDLAAEKPAESGDIYEVAKQIFG
jgi:DNA polymerase III gamma/tau subunit